MSKFHERLAGLGFASYQDYLNGDHWRDFKKRYVAAKMPTTCAVCGCKPVQLHHHSYDRLGKEEFADITPLCRAHHEAVHEWLKEHKGGSVVCTFKAIKALRLAMGLAEIPEQHVPKPRKDKAEARRLKRERKKARRQRQRERIEAAKLEQAPNPLPQQKPKKLKKEKKHKKPKYTGPKQDRFNRVDVGLLQKQEAEKMAADQRLRRYQEANKNADFCAAKIMIGPADYSKPQPAISKRQRRKLRKRGRGNY